MGADLSADHLAVAETDASGSPVNSFSVPPVTYGKLQHQAKVIIGDAVASVVAYARQVGKPIVIERFSTRLHIVDNCSTIRYCVRMVHLPSRKAVARLGLHPQTLRRYAAEGKIPYYRNAGGQCLYDVDAYLRGKADPQVVCYCRVSSARQRGDLNRQVAQMREVYPDAEIVTDVAGGLNWKRRGLLTILERLHRGDKLELVVAHRDRLARFGFELIEWLVQQNGGAVVVLNQSDASPESELTEDLLAILDTFSCRMHGLRRYSAAIAQDQGLSEQRSEDPDQDLA